MPRISDGEAKKWIDAYDSMFAKPSVKELLETQKRQWKRGHGSNALLLLDDVCYDKTVLRSKTITFIFVIFRVRNEPSLAKTAQSLRNSINVIVMLSCRKSSALLYNLFCKIRIRCPNHARFEKRTDAIYPRKFVISSAWAIVHYRDTHVS